MRPFLVLVVLFILLAFSSVESRHRRRYRKRKTPKPEPTKPTKPTKPSQCRSYNDDYSDDDDDGGSRKAQNCRVGAWKRWSQCSFACGNRGRQKRTRKLLQPAICGGICPFQLSQSRDCNRYCYNGGILEPTRCKCSSRYGGECCEQVHGGWSCWGLWESCSKTCGEGIQARLRSCDMPLPANGGRKCLGMSSESRKCNTSPCPVDGGWTSWGNWSKCSVTCGGGTQRRNRSCTKPPVAYGGKPCEGLTEMSQYCNKHVFCPVDGGWSLWNTWSQCTTTCAEGTRSRSRSCSNPPVSNGGKSCSGQHVETEKCNKDIPCPVDGGWSLWGNWGPCNKRCSKTRRRTCTRPPPSNNGLKCIGSPLQNVKCSFQECIGGNGGGGKGQEMESDSNERQEGSSSGTTDSWHEWNEWSECSKSCGDNSWKIRSRTCNSVIAATCHGDSIQVTFCDVRPC